jgi:hypothetical protein
MELGLNAPSPTSRTRYHVKDPIPYLLAFINIPTFQPPLAQAGQRFARHFHDCFVSRHDPGGSRRVHRFFTLEVHVLVRFRTRWRC